MTVHTSRQTATRRPAFWRFPVPFYIAAAIDALLGFDFIIAGNWIAAQAAPATPAVLGIATSTVVQILGLVLIVFAAETVLAARSSGLMRRLLPLIVGTNWAFVPLCVAFVVFAGSALSTAAIALLLIIAAVTGVLAHAQQRSLRHA